MNEELQKQLAGLIATATAAGKNAYDFAAQQAPELIQQLLAWKFAEAIFACVACALFIYPCWLLVQRGLKEAEKRWIDQEDGWILGGIMGAVIGICLVLAVIATAFNALEIKIAPKVYLMEYISKLVKK